MVPDFYNFPCPGYYELGARGDPILPDDWFEVTLINTMEFERYVDRFDDAVIWIMANVQDYKNVCRWIMINDCQYYFFKSKDDAAIFHLSISDTDV